MLIWKRCVAQIRDAHSSMTASMMTRDGWDRAGQEDGGGMGTRGICTEVAGMLEEVATASDEQEEEPPPRVPAAQRFATAVQASLAAADATGVPIDEDPNT